MKKNDVEKRNINKAIGYRSSKENDAKKAYKSKFRHSELQDKFVIALIVCFVLVICFVIYKNQIIKNNSNFSEADIAVQEQTDNTDFLNNDFSTSGTSAEAENDAPKTYENALFCWGDSFSANSSDNLNYYGYFLYENLVNTNIQNITGVYSAGNDYETLMLLAGKTGAYPFWVEDFTIPADESETEIVIHSSYDDSELMLSKTVNPGLNPCVIQGVEGEISCDGEKITFKRLEQGSEVEVAKGSEISTNTMNNMSDSFYIFFFGNPQYTPEVCVELYKAMTENTDRYVILSPIIGTQEQLQPYEEAYEEAFGNHFINLREYLCSQAFDDYEITIDGSDLNQLKENQVPDGFMLKNLRLNDITAKIAGDLVYDKLLELNIIN